MPAADRLRQLFSRGFCLLFWCVTATAFFSAPAAAEGLSPQEVRGRQLYLSGTSQSGVPVVAYFGKDLLEVPGESATCDSCHGYDGTGRRESGVIPSNITWRHLMKSYGHIHPDGLEHGPFTEKSLKSYMEDGLYPGGRPGDPSMPVYEMAAGDLDDLMAYLKKLGSTLDPGLSDTHIRIGTLHPAEGPLAELSRVMAGTIAAYFDDINAQGGIYGRRLQLVDRAVRAEAGLPLSGLSDPSGEGLFALVNTVTPGLEAELWRVTEQQQLPLVAPYAPLALDDQQLHRYRFFAAGGVREQALALALHATRTSSLKAPRIRILYQQRPGMLEIVSAVEGIFQAKGWKLTETVGYAGGGLTSGMLQRLRGDNPDLLLYLGGEGELEPLLRIFGEPECRTEVYLPGMLAAGSISRLPASFKGRLRLSFAALPADRKEWALQEFRAMAARRGLTISQPTLQLTAYTAARILVEGLRSAGRNLSRERLVESLEGLFEFDSGLAPLVSYSKNRRVGSLGAHVVEFDPGRSEAEGFVVPRGWISTATP